MKDLDLATKFGREKETSYKNCLQLFGSFGTQKEQTSTILQRTQNNLSGKDYDKAIELVHKEMEGYLIEEKISSARMAFIYVQIQNNLKVPSDTLRISYGIEMIFKPKPQSLKFTSPVDRNSSGGWSQEGIDLYFEYYEREKKERKEMKTKYKEDARENRCDYFKARVVTKEDNSDGVDENSKLNEIVDYESEYSSNKSVNGDETEDIF